jgi:hypothetical protein
MVVGGAKQTSANAAWVDIEPSETVVCEAQKVVDVLGNAREINTANYALTLSGLTHAGRGGGNQASLPVGWNVRRAYSLPNAAVSLCVNQP